MSGNNCQEEEERLEEINTMSMESGKGAAFVSGMERNNRNRGGAQRLGSWTDAVRRTWPGCIESLEIEGSPVQEEFQIGPLAGLGRAARAASR